MLSGMNRSIFIIRHGEKPPPGRGVTAAGKQDDHSLIPLGWQRAGALATLFAGSRAAFPEPTQLIAPKYAKGASRERTHETIAPLAALLRLEVESPYKEGDEKKLAGKLAAATSGVTLICWEHKHLPAIAANIPTAPGTTIPGRWPGKRFDVVWCFALDSDTGHYQFSQVPQMLLAGDRDTPIGG
jgi:broad specificity phosphatase PhoE